MKQHHNDCDLGDQLPPDYYRPGSSIMHGKTVYSEWVEQPVPGGWMRFERESLGAPWVRVERWIEFFGMPWNPSGLYRYRGRTLSGWPQEVQFYDPDTKEWWDCPNINAHMRIARATNPS